MTLAETVMNHDSEGKDRLRRGLAVALMLLLTVPALSVEQDAPQLARFSSGRPDGSLPGGWKPVLFRDITRHTHYRLVEDGGTVVLQAHAQASASGLIHPLDVSVLDYPRLRWRWKVADLVRNSNLATKTGDDYAARVYVTFAYSPERLSVLDRLKYRAARLWWGEYPPHAVLIYLWDSRAAVGTLAVNAFSERARMIVLRSGGPLDQWVEEQRDIHDDYRRAFGQEPPRISGVALMSDTDGTGEAVRAWYGDIRLERAGPP